MASSRRSLSFKWEFKIPFELISLSLTPSNKNKLIEFCLGTRKHGGCLGYLVCCGCTRLWQNQWWIARVIRPEKSYTKLNERWLDVCRVIEVTVQACSHPSHRHASNCYLHCTTKWTTWTCRQSSVSRWNSRIVWLCLASSWYCRILDWQLTHSSLCSRFHSRTVVDSRPAQVHLWLHRWVSSGRAVQFWLVDSIRMPVLVRHLLAHLSWSVCTGRRASLRILKLSWFYNAHIKYNNYKESSKIKESYASSSLKSACFSSLTDCSTTGVRCFSNIFLPVRSALVFSVRFGVSGVETTFCDSVCLLLEPNKSENLKLISK